MSLLTQFYPGTGSGGGGYSQAGGVTGFNWENVNAVTSTGTYTLAIVNTSQPYYPVDGTTEWPGTFNFLYSADGGVTWGAGGEGVNSDQFASNIYPLGGQNTISPVINPNNGDSLIAWGSTTLTKRWLGGVGGPPSVTCGPTSNTGYRTYGAYYAGGVWGALGVYNDQAGTLDMTSYRSTTTPLDTWSTGFYKTTQSSYPIISTTQRGPNGPVYIAYNDAGAKVGVTTDWSTLLDIADLGSQVARGPGNSTSSCIIAGGVGTQNGLYLTSTGLYYTTNNWTSITAVTGLPSFNTSFGNIFWSEEAQAYYVFGTLGIPGQTFLYKSTTATGSAYTQVSLDPIANNGVLLKDISPGTSKYIFVSPTSVADYGYVYSNKLV